MTRSEAKEEEVESRWEAAPAVLLVIVLQLGLALTSRVRGWRLWEFPWWAWLISTVPAAILLLALATDRSRAWLDRAGRRREAGLTLFGITSFANALSLIALTGSIIGGHEHSGGELLIKGGVIWTTNVVVFGLWYWAFDRGGPGRRARANPPPPDFQFPQMENPQLAAPGWHPRLFDYVYISFTNAIAFSPTDAMPLTRRAKVMMLVESSVSAITVLLVAARAVNIFK
ncbi:MAG TPA: hypothetical protein VG652_11715 [Gaiellaceae bacterium]|nr:hypothetical protein [Gaiellaceae bacterium]